MPIDVDVQSFAEENANITDCNTKYVQLTTFIDNPSLNSSHNNKIPVRRSGAWSIEGEEAYNGYYQDFGNISGETILFMNGDSCRTAMVATVVGDTFITGFDSNFSTGVVYTLFIKQDAIGGFSVRWPYGASVLKQVGTDPNQITEVYIVKLPTGKIFIKCQAFQNTTEVGSVIKEFESPKITFPDGLQAPMSFTWLKNQPIPYGGTLTGLYSDWEIADDALYTNLLFSSYNNTIDLYAIQVVLTQAGQVYMRTRYGGLIGGTPIVSSWDEAVVELSGMGGDKYWDQTVLCINANKHGWEGSRKIVDEKGFNTVSVYGDTQIKLDGGNNSYINFGGVGRLEIPDSIVNRQGSGDFSLEFFFSAVAVTGAYRFILIKSISSGNSPFVPYIDTSGKVGCSIYFSDLSNITLLSSSVLSVDTIYHLSVNKSGNLFTLSINGVFEDSETSEKTIYSNSSHNFHIGSASDGLYPFTGKIYSIRYTRGVCRYTSDFQISLVDPYFKTGNLWWTPETKNTSNEKFLDYKNWDKVICCINGYGVANSTDIVDSAGNIITLSGDTKIAVSSNISYVNFDGTGDTLNLPFPLNYIVGNYDFCLEFFYKAGSTATGTILSDASTFGGYYSIRVDSDTSGTGINVFLYDSASNLINITSSVLTTYGNIVHVALVRNGANILLFINGASAGSAAITSGRALYSAPSNLKLGNYGNSQYFTGAIYSFRISMFARYTSAFSAPDLTRPYFITKPKVENWSGTPCLINAFGLPAGSTDIRDAKGNAISVYGDAKIGVDPNGLQYINFDGVGDYLYSSVGLMDFGTADFTISFFISFNSVSGVHYLINTYQNSSYGVSIELNSTTINVSLSGDGVDLTSIKNNFTINTLYHVALVRSSGTVMLFFNGIFDSSVANSTNIYSTSPLSIGRMYNLAYYGNFKLYSLRITKGKALYTSNFNVDLTNPYFPAIDDSISDFWLDGNDYSKITLSTGVSKIIDKSGNNIEASQVTSNKQPSLVQGHQNGLMALSLDGIDDSLEGFSIPQKFGSYVLAVVDTSNLDTGDRVLFNRSTSAAPYPPAFYLGTGSATKKPGTFWGTSYALIHNDVVSGKALFLFYIDSSSVSIGINGNTPVSNSHGNSVLSEWLSIGSSVAQQPKITIMEFFLINRSITENTLKKIIGYLAHKWGLTENLPIDHVYKAGFPTEDIRTDNYWYATILCVNGSDIIRPTEIIDSSRTQKVSMYGTVTIPFDTSLNKPYINFNGGWNSLHFPFKQGSFGSGDFTIEMFVQFSGWNANSSRLWGANGDVIHEIDLVVDSSGVLVCWASSNGSSWDMVSNTNIAQLSLNTLYHIAAVRSGAFLWVFINGTRYTLSSTLGSTVLYNYSGSRSFGGQVNNYNRSVIGRFYSYRVTKGIARYTENFQVDSANPYFPKKNGFTEEYINSVVEFIPSGSLANSALAPIGFSVNSVGYVSSPLAALQFNAVSDYIQLNDNLNFMHDGVSKFTLDFGIYINSYPSVIHNIIGNFSNNSPSAYSYFQCAILTDGSLIFQYAGIGSGSILVASDPGSVIVDQENKARIVFDGTYLVLYLNGVLCDSVILGSFTTSTAGTVNVKIGSYPLEPSYGLVGYISGLRITKMAAEGAIFSLPFVH